MPVDLHSLGSIYVAQSNVTSRIQNVTLPTNQYHFYYDSSTSLLNEIVYPTGAWVKYTWQILPGQEGVQYRTVPSSGGGLWQSPMAGSPSLRG